MAAPAAYGHPVVYGEGPLPKRPRLARGPVVCYNCQGPHSVQVCPVGAKICHLCGAVGHISKQCPRSLSGPGMACLNCAGPHDVRACPIKTKVCHTCGQLGHVSRACGGGGGGGHPAMAPSPIPLTYSHAPSPGPATGLVCNKCGQHGHIARVCTVGPAPVACLNCGGPHPLRACPTPDKVCHKCSEVGHISRECPNATSLEPGTAMENPALVCFNCGGPHAGRCCPVQSKICHKCFQEGHVSKECPNEASSCLNCGGDHDLRSCPAGGTVCHSCGQVGHISKKCPAAGLAPPPHAFAAPPIQCLNCGGAHHVKECPIGVKVCHQCGGRGHISKQCPSRGQPPVIAVVPRAGGP